MINEYNTFIGYSVLLIIFAMECIHFFLEYLPLFMYSQAIFFTYVF